MDLDGWLEAVTVIEDAHEDQPACPPGWFGVSTDVDGGYIAFFQHEVDAFRFRLDYINRKMNP